LKTGGWMIPAGDESACWRNLFLWEGARPLIETGEITEEVCQDGAEENEWFCVSRGRGAGGGNLRDPRPRDRAAFGSAGKPETIPPRFPAGDAGRLADGPTAPPPPWARAANFTGKLPICRGADPASQRAALNAPPETCSPAA